MKVYGLTGGIGSGKSTVAQLLRGLGHEVIDADAIAREVVRPGTPGLVQLVAAFGEDILDGAGALDRPRLAARVFGDEAARARLNAVLHPLIGAESARRLAALAAAGMPMAFYEAALLVENARHLPLDGLIVVRADPESQRRRVAARDGLDPEAIDRRLRAQTSDAVRCAAANLVLENSGSRDALEAQVIALHQRLARGESLPPPKNGDSPGSTAP